MSREDHLPKNLRKLFPKAIERNGDTHARPLPVAVDLACDPGRPGRTVLEASRAVLFGFFGFDKSAALLHAQRINNPHLVVPPPATFIGLSAAASRSVLEIPLTGEGEVSIVMTAGQSLRQDRNTAS